MSLRMWKDRMVARLLARYPGLVKRWSGNRDFSAEMAGYRAGPAFTPWTPPAKPVSECTVASGDDGRGEGENMTAEAVKSPPPRGLTVLWRRRASDEFPERLALAVERLALAVERRHGFSMSAVQRLHGFSMLVALRLLLTS